MPEKLLMLKPYTDFFVSLLNDLFMVQGMEPAYQQVVKVFTMTMIMVLFLGLTSIVLKFIANVLQPATQSLAKRPEYVLYIVFACLLLIFTSRVSYYVAVVTLLVFIGLHIASVHYLKIPLFGRPEENAQTKDEKPQPAKSSSTPAEKKT